MRKKIVTISCAMIFLSLSCEDERKEFEYDVIITSVWNEVIAEPNSPEYTKYAFLSYLMANSGSEKISGWKIFFQINIRGGPQIYTKESIYYELPPGDTSDVRTVFAIIPDYYDEAMNGSVRNCEMW